MLTRLVFASLLLLGLGTECVAQEESKSKPVELEALRASIGTWDGEIEVWSQGLDADPIKFKGVETNRAFGEFWVASDFESEYMGQTMKIHSIVGLDLDQNKLVGTVIDHGPYAAKMTGEYDKNSETISWITRAKDTKGNPLVQKTTVTQVSDDERVLVLSVPGENKNEFTKFMQIKFIKRN